MNYPDKENENEIINLIYKKAHLRDLYRFLADFFYTPKNYLEENKEAWIKLLESFKILEIDPSSALELINNLDFASIEELLVEFTRLFIGSIEYVAPPYASYYLEGRLFGDSALKALEFYKKAELNLKDDFNELPDHIAVQFEFMSYLISQEVKYLYEKNYPQASKFYQLQREFLETCVFTWINSFCNKIKEGTHSKFYYSLADVLQSFIYAQKT